MKKLNRYKGQSSLELAVVFVTLLLFLLGMLRILFWGNTTLLQRHQNYMDTRGTTGTWPLPATTPLSDNMLFRGGN